MDHFDQSGLRFWVRPPLAPEEANSCDALCLLQLSIRRNLLSSSSVGSDPTAQPSPPPPSSLLLVHRRSFLARCCRPETPHRAAGLDMLWSSRHSLAFIKLALTSTLRTKCSPGWCHSEEIISVIHFLCQRSDR